MELHEGVIIIAVVAVSSALFYKVYRFAMRGKTYEEAIAEQRKLPLEHLLLGRSGKDKNKDKKQKKVGKKVKEKPSEKEKSEHLTKVNLAPKADSNVKNPLSAVNKADVTVKASNNTAPSKINVANQNLHSEKHRAVEFGKPEAEVVDDQTVVQQQDETKVKKKKKADKGVKPILLNKDEVSPVDMSAVKDEPSSPFTINHFEEKKPKDEFLKRKCSEEAAVKTRNEKSSDFTEQMKLEKVTSTAAAAPTPAAAPQLQVAEAVLVELSSQTVSSTVAAAPPDNKRKKKKSDLATLQQMAGSGGVNVTLLEPLIRKAELSRSDLQILIDLLLNKQQESGVESAEWTEGRQDPVVKLKKQLAEKEKALAEEQEAAQGWQVRVREIRAELNGERSRLNALVKKLEGTVEGLTVKLQNESESHAKEKAVMNNQLQELNNKLSDERMRFSKLQEQENSALSSIQQEFHAQRQQLELHISRLNDQLEEETASVKSERARLQEEVEAREKANILLTAELRKVQEELNELKASTSGSKEERERLIELANNAEAAAKIAANEANSAREMARHWEEESRNSSCKLEQQRAEMEAIISSLKIRNTELQAEVNRAKEETTTDKSRTEVTLKEAEERAKKAEDALSRLEAELKSTHQRSLQEKESFIQELTKELTYYKTEIPKLSETLEIQKKKNDELRHKNWKAMEALTLAENNLKAHLKNSQNVVIEECQKAIMEEQEAVKQFLQRLLPNVIVENVKPHSEWLERFESSACDYLKQSNVEKVCDQHDKEKECLQAKIVHYQNIVKDTEAILSKLQMSVEQQEAEWAEQLRQKDVELKQVIGERNDLVTTLEEMQGLEKLKESSEGPSEVCGVQFAFSCIEKSLPAILSETQDKVKELEDRLATEEDEKKMLVAERDGLLQKNSKLEAEYSTILSQAAKTELLQKEINSLKNELSTRQEQNEAMSKEVVRLNSLVKIGQASLSQEQLQVKEMEEEIEKLKVQSQNHTATNGPASESTLTESNSKEVKSPSNPVSSSELPNMEKKVKSKKKKTSNQDSVKRRKFSGWFSKKLTSRKKVKNSLSSLSETNKKD